MVVVWYTVSPWLEARLCGREGTASTSFPKKVKVGRKPLTLDWSHSWTWDRKEALQSFSHTFVSKFIPTKSIYS